MSSKFLDRLDEIREGAAPRLGFGTTRPPKLPGLALVIAAGSKDGAASASGMSPDAVFVSGASVSQASEIGEAATGIWGIRADGLTSADAASWREAGADVWSSPCPGRPWEP